MNILSIKEQICTLLECTVSDPIWDDVLFDNFSDVYEVRNIQIIPNAKNLNLNIESDNFTFSDIPIQFDVQMWSHSESGKIEHGACLASVHGHIIRSSENIQSIDVIEVELKRYYIPEPKYDFHYNYCENISNIISSIKRAYPFPDDNLLAKWAGVRIDTIKKWQTFKSRARYHVVEKLLESFDLQNNIADIMID